MTHRAAQRLPRLALLLLCIAYVVPGVFGRDPWRNADLTAYGYMASIAQGHSPWWAPTLGGLPPADAALLPYWIGAAAIRALGPWLDPALAARLPFALLLVLALAMTWYTTYHLARTEAAQPLPFAFGGEADPVDYARAIADGALLALMASLGLLMLGHETTPELCQLASITVYLYALAAGPFRPRLAPVAALLSLPALAASGAPAVATLAGIAGTWISAQSSYPLARRLTLFLGAGTLGAIATASALGAWQMRIAPPDSGSDLKTLAQLLAWFTWPTLPLAAWTVWRWRLHWRKRHVSIPLALALVAMVASVAMGGVDRTLMLALPSLAVLAAFTLPTLQRSSGAAIDWFSVFFFSISAAAGWLFYVAMHTGVPAKPAASLMRQVPGFVPQFSAPELALAALGTAAWVWLVFWRTGRHRHPLWKSMVLPAAGVAVCWLLAMTLLLPALDYARSDRVLVQRLGPYLSRQDCVAMPGASRAQVSAVAQLGGYRVDATTPMTRSTCGQWLRQERVGSPRTPPSGWTIVAEVRRPTDRTEAMVVYRRAPS